MQNVQSRKWKQVEKFVCTFVFGMSFLFVSLIFFARWPQWWELTVPEQSPITWMESLLLFLNTLIAVSLAILGYLQSNVVKLRWWSILALGFFYLMLDERFAIHERLRDNYLEPFQVKIPLFFWTKPGDFILLLYLIIGLFLGFQYLKLFKKRKSAYYWLLCGFLLFCVSVFVDSFNYESYAIIIQNWQQFVEELFEIGGMLSFFTALFLLLSFHIQTFGGKDD